MDSKPALTIIRLSGGLGNQLFQYAMGRSISIAHKTELVLDVSSYEHQNPKEAQRRYTLGQFRIKERFAKSDDFKEIRIPSPSRVDFFARFIRKLLRFLERNEPLEKRVLVYEPSFRFHSEILEHSKSGFFAGVWQSEKYFKKYEKEIRSDITLTESLPVQAELMAKEMNTTDSIALHVRRGDQVSDPRLLQKFGSLGEEYYKHSIEYIRERVNNPHFYVFSDEIDWVQSNLNLGSDVTYVSSYGFPDYVELMLMSNCKHNITAKSSYSWWGAWLNTNPEKIVIAPKVHFNISSIDDSDLVPSTWILL